MMAPDSFDGIYSKHLKRHQLGLIPIMPMSYRHLYLGMGEIGGHMACKHRQEGLLQQESKPDPSESISVATLFAFFPSIALSLNQVLLFNMKLPNELRTAISTSIYTLGSHYSYREGCQ
jgi:hypothetical protein